MTNNSPHIKILLFSLIFMVFGCGDNERNQKAFDNLQREIEIDFKPYIVYKQNPVDEGRMPTEMCVSKYKTICTHEVDSFRLNWVKGLTEYYQHHDYILSCTEYDPSGHWSYPPIEDQSYLPDSIFEKYNAFSQLFNSDRFQRSDTAIFRYFRNYVDIAEPPFYGYKAKAEVIWFVDSVGYTNELDVSYDTLLSKVHYQSYCWDELEY